MNASGSDTASRLSLAVLLQKSTLYLDIGSHHFVNVLVPTSGWGRQGTHIIICIFEAGEGTNDLLIHDEIVGVAVVHDTEHGKDSVVAQRDYAGQPARFNQNLLRAGNELLRPSGGPSSKTKERATFFRVFNCINISRRKALGL